MIGDDDGSLADAGGLRDGVDGSLLPILGDTKPSSYSPHCGAVLGFDGRSGKPVTFELGSNQGCVILVEGRGVWEPGSLLVTDNGL